MPMNLANRIGKAILKHPVAATGTAGVGVAMVDNADKANELHSTLNRLYMGVPSEKYSDCTPLEKFADHKEDLTARTLFVKLADKIPSKSFGESFEEGVGKQVGIGVATGGITLLRHLVGNMVQSLRDRGFTGSKRQSILQNIVSTDPHIRTFDEENPGKIEEAYETMVKFAPTLSTDPHVVLSFLRNVAMSGSALSYHDIKGLADAEAAVLHARNEGLPSWTHGG